MFASVEEIQVLTLNFMQNWHQQVERLTFSQLTNHKNTDNDSE